MIQVLLLNCTQLNVFKYCYLMLIVLFDSSITVELHTAECFQVLLLNCAQLNVQVQLHQLNSFQVLLLMLNCTQLNVFKYCYLMLIVLFDSSITVELHTAECFQVLLFNANSFIWFKYYCWIAHSWMFSSIAI